MHPTKNDAQIAYSINQAYKMINACIIVKNETDKIKLFTDAADTFNEAYDLMRSQFGQPYSTKMQSKLNNHFKGSDISTDVINLLDQFINLHWALSDAEKFQSLIALNKALKHNCPEYNSKGAVKHPFLLKILGEKPKEEVPEKKVSRKLDTLKYYLSLGRRKEKLTNKKGRKAIPTVESDSDDELDESYANLHTLSDQLFDSDSLSTQDDNESTDSEKSNHSPTNKKTPKI